MLGGLSQLINFISVRQAVKVPLLFYLVSVLILASGVVILFNPFQAATVPFYCFGSNSHCICGKRSDSLVVLSPQTE